VFPTKQPLLSPETGASSALAVAQPSRPRPAAAAAPSRQTPGGTSALTSPEAIQGSHLTDQHFLPKYLLRPPEKPHIKGYCGLTEF